MPVLNNWQATPPLVLLVGMSADFYTTFDAVRLYDVSERTLRRRIAKGIPGATKNEEGSWLLPATWLEQFGLRDGGTPEETVDMSSGMPPVMPTTPNFSELWQDTKGELEESRKSLEALRSEKETQIDQLREQKYDLRGQLSGVTVELKYSEAAVKRVTAERDRATSDLEQARSEAERLRVDLTAEQAARTAEAAAAESIAADKDQEIERQRTKMGELRRELRLAEDQAKRGYRRAKRKQAKRAAKASRKA